MSFELGSDPEVAERLLSDLCGDGEPLVHDLGAFYRYDPAIGIYVPIPRPTVERHVHIYDGATFPNDNGRDRPLRLSQSKINGIVQCAAAQAFVADFFATAPAGMVFRNGFLLVTADGVTLAPHSPTHRATAAVPFDFDPEAEIVLFARFFDGVFRDDADRSEKVSLIQEFTGASLIGKATKFQQALVPVGEGENGKSRLIEILLPAFPTGSQTAIPPQDFGNEYRRHMLSRALINAVSELPEADILDSESFKAVISGDSVVGREIRQSPFSFIPKAGHIFAANRLPGTKDQSHGFWRRMVPVTFNRKFLETDPDRDPDIAQKVVEAELPAIVVWAVRGAVRALRQGRYTVPASTLVAHQKWRRGADPVRLFTEEALVVREEPVTSGRILYEAYRRWSSANGYTTLLNNNQFTDRLETLGIKRKRESRGSFWNVEVLP